MNIRSSFGILAILCIPALSGCGGIGNFDFSGIGSLTFYSIAVSPEPLSIAAGTTQTFTATATEAGGAPVQWSLGSATAPGGVGTLSATSGNTVTYTAPLTPPIYAGPIQNNQQGTVILTATVQPTNGNVYLPTFVTFSITTPSVSVGLAPATATVALGTTLQFGGYAVGSVNHGLTWQVDGVTGGSTAYGTITQSTIWPYGGVYTAPAIMPMTGNTVTITLISQADPAKTQTATVTLQ